MCSPISGQWVPVAAQTPKCRKSIAIMLAATLGAPAVLSDLTGETRAHVKEAYVQVNHPTTKAMDEREEALAVVGAAAENGDHASALTCRDRASRVRRLVRDGGRDRYTEGRLGST